MPPDDAFSCESEAHESSLNQWKSECINGCPSGPLCLPYWIASRTVSLKRQALGAIDAGKWYCNAWVKCSPYTQAWQARL